MLKRRQKRLRSFKFHNFIGCFQVSSWQRRGQTPLFVAVFGLLFVVFSSLIFLQFLAFLLTCFISVSVQHNSGRVWRGSILPRTVAGGHWQAVQFRGAGRVDDCGRHSHRCRIRRPPGRQPLHLSWCFLWEGFCGGLCRYPRWCFFSQQFWSLLRITSNVITRDQWLSCVCVVLKWGVQLQYSQA